MRLRKNTRDKCVLMGSVRFARGCLYDVEGKKKYESASRLRNA